MDNLAKLLHEEKIKFVDLRFTDILGREHHITVAANLVDEAFLQEGKYFDGSSIQGWRPINQSDMVLKPQPETAVLDPFTLDPTVIMRCEVYDPSQNTAYDRCPRSIAKKAEAYLQACGIADAAFFGPEPEFFIFDDIRFGTDINKAFYFIDSVEGCWNTHTTYDIGNMGHRPGQKGGYFPVPPY